jgi:hypothetical protein
MRRFRFMAVITGAVLAATMAAGPAQAALPPLPVGCTAAPPTIGLITTRAGLPASIVTTSGITCTARSGWTVTSTSLSIEFLSKTGSWDILKGALITLPLPTAAASVTKVCNLSPITHTCVATPPRRGRVYYLFVNTVTKSQTVDILHSAVQPPIS